MDVGLELRQARERQGLSLQQLSNTTKISQRVLQAIEASDEARLPAPVFARSFVKTYAAEVRLNPDTTMRRYFEQFVPPEMPDASEPVREPDPKMPRWSPADAMSGPFGTAAVLLVVAGTAFLLAARNHTAAKPDMTPPLASGAGVTPDGPLQPAPVAMSGTTPAPAAVLHLAIAPSGPCWVQATVGGETVFATLLNAGDRRTVDATSDVTLRVGDPAVFGLSIDGMPARIPGEPGRAVTVRITRDNLRQFLTR
jgi:transcriptional regulator with XRE-family HTH domain